MRSANTRELIANREGSLRITKQPIDLRTDVTRANARVMPAIEQAVVLMPLGIIKPVPLIAVLAGGGRLTGKAENITRRRNWRPEEKLALLAEVGSEGGHVAMVALSHGLSESLRCFLPTQKDYAEAHNTFPERFRCASASPSSAAVAASA